MATNVNNDSGNSLLGFIVGGLLVVAVIFGLLYYNGKLPGRTDSTSIRIETPASPLAPLQAPKK